ncbi:MAG: FAD-binding oxidoreductase [Hamadaea sp.]|uniref:FAD-binding oxidoreductase n=1 Tax=Hamadaea sp. TaxID=2024425 RepID=UPI0017C7E5DB|nr:FAD-binding oxidoreductase [Hamadaea sp.]NUT17631.1 FAD-binding oxidoreductase [Hamadaea sp.]
MIPIPRTLAAARALEGTVPIRAPIGTGRWTARPQRLDEVATVLRFAAEKGREVRPRGAATKSAWFTEPSDVDITLSTGDLSAWHYEPGSPVVTVGAGVPLQVAQIRLAAYGLRLALDPRSPGATVGGILATDELGPLAMKFGRPSEQLRGAWGVRAGGSLIALGDPDPTTGPAHPESAERHPDPADRRWLTTGVLVSATLPVQPMPPASRYVSHDVASPLEISELLARMEACCSAPTAIELDLPARSLSRISHVGTLTVLVEGSVASATDRAGELADAFGPKTGFHDVAPEGWARYPWRGDDVAVRLDAPADALASVAYAMRDAANAPLAFRASLGTGVGYAALPAHLPGEVIRAVLETCRDVLMGRGGEVTVLSAPAELRRIIGLERLYA